MRSICIYLYIHMFFIVYKCFKATRAVAPPLTFVFSIHCIRWFRSERGYPSKLSALLAGQANEVTYCTWYSSCKTYCWTRYVYWDIWSLDQKWPAILVGSADLSCNPRLNAWHMKCRSFVPRQSIFTDNSSVYIYIRLIKLKRSDHSGQKIHRWNVHACILRIFSLIDHEWSFLKNQLVMVHSETSLCFYSFWCHQGLVFVEELQRQTWMASHGTSTHLVSLSIYIYVACNAGL